MNSRLGLLFPLVLVACGSSDPVNSAPIVPEAPAVEEQEEPYELFGEALDPEVAETDFATLLASPDAYLKQIVKVRAVVRASCQVRGCWMEIRNEADKSSDGLTVRFEGYSFFVPLNSRASRVVIQGELEVQTLTKAQVKEVEAEGGTVQLQPDGTAKVLTFMATGVEMRGRKQK